MAINVTHSYATRRVLFPNTISIEVSAVTYVSKKIQLVASDFPIEGYDWLASIILI